MDKITTDIQEYVTVLVYRSNPAYKRQDAMQQAKKKEI